MEQIGPSIQEWTKQNLWKTAIKKFDEVWMVCFKQIIYLYIF